MKKNYLKILLVIALLIGLIIIKRSFDLISKDEIIDMIELMSANTKYAGLIFICTTIVCSVFGVPISWFKAVGGMYFGVEKGFIFAILSATVSCAISFIIARILGRDLLQSLYDRFIKKKLSQKKQSYFNNKTQLGFTYIFLLRNVYFIPFTLTNYFMGITNVSFLKYIVASFLGMIPGTFIYTYFFAKSLSIYDNPAELITPLLLVFSYYCIVYIMKNKFQRFNSTSLSTNVGKEKETSLT